MYRLTLGLWGAHLHTPRGQVTLRLHLLGPADITVREHGRPRLLRRALTFAERREVMDIMVELSPVRMDPSRFTRPG